MKLPNLKIGDMLLIRWCDAHAPRPDLWTAIEDLDEYPIEMGISSLGFFLDKRDGYVRISGEFSGSDVCLDVVNRVLNIPIGCMKSVKVL